MSLAVDQTSILLYTDGDLIWSFQISHIRRDSTILCKIVINSAHFSSVYSRDIQMYCLLMQKRQMQEDLNSNQKGQITQTARIMFSHLLLVGSSLVDSFGFICSGLETSVFKNVVNVYISAPPFQEKYPCYSAQITEHPVNSFLRASFLVESNQIVLQH